MGSLLTSENSCDPTLSCVTRLVFAVPCEFCVLRGNLNILFCTVALGPRCSQFFQGHYLKEFQENTDAQLRVSSGSAQIKEPCNVCSSVFMKLKVFLKHWNSSQTGFLCFPEFWVWFLVLPSFSSLIWYLNGKDPIIFGLCLLWNSGCLTANGIGFLKPLEFRGAGRSWCSSLCQHLCCSWPWLWEWGGECVSYCDVVFPFNLEF